jgi:serine/threonine protein kinase
MDSPTSIRRTLPWFTVICTSSVSFLRRKERTFTFPIFFLFKSNVLVDNEGNARLADFGLSDVLNRIEIATTDVAEYARYQAPEIFLAEDGNETLYTTHTDVFSFSMVALAVCGIYLTGFFFIIEGCAHVLACSFFFFPRFRF